MCSHWCHYTYLLAMFYGGKIRARCWPSGNVLLLICTRDKCGPSYCQLKTKPEQSVTIVILVVLISAPPPPPQKNKCFVSNSDASPYYHYICHVAWSCHLLCIHFDIAKCDQAYPWGPEWQLAHQKTLNKTINDSPTLYAVITIHQPWQWYKTW